MPVVRHDRVLTTLLAIATVGVCGASLTGLVGEPRAVFADNAKPSDGSDAFDPDSIFSSSDPAMGMGGGGGGGGMGGGMSGGSSGGSAGGGSSGGSSGGSAQAGGSQPTSGGNFTGGGGMGGGGTSSGGGGATAGAMAGGGTPAGGGATAGGKNAKSSTAAGAAGGGKSSATSSKASKARISWLSAHQKARLPEALEGIYQAEIAALNDGALLAMRRATCVAGPGPTTPIATPGAPTAPAPGSPAPAPGTTAPAAGAPVAPSAESEKPPTLSDGAPLPKGAEELQALAEKCEKEKRYDDALVATQSLVKVRGSAKDWAYEGFLQEQFGTYEAADEAYGKALAIEPTHLGAKVGKVYDAIALGKATACYEGMAKDVNAPKNDVLWLLATSYLATSAKQAEPARAALEQAVTAAGQDVAKLRAAIELGIDQKVRGPLTTALDICLRSAPDDVRFHGLRLVLVVEEGPITVALQSLDDAEKLAPSDVEPLFFEAYLQVKDEKYDKAIAILKRALKLAPTNARCALLDAHALDRKGSKEALMAYAHATELDPKVAEPWIASALLVHNKGDYEDSKGKLMAASKAEPRLPEPLYYLAIIQGDRLGFLGLALDTLRIYRKLGGEDESALDWLQTLEDAENN